MFSKQIVALAFLLCLLEITEVFGHGKLIDPPNRSSMWRYGYPVTPNYDDNGIFCGGRAVQWEINEGRCGTCGDDYRNPQPRANENTGLYGTGIVGKRYRKGSNIQVSVQITANHLGFFKFSICKMNNPSTYEKEECFQDVKLADGGDVYKLPSPNVGVYKVDLKLPEGLSCERCVLRWTYTAGNDWGFCPDGTGKLGCGPQETFRTCSDISIF